MKVKLSKFCFYFAWLHQKSNHAQIITPLFFDVRAIANDGDHNFDHENLHCVTMIDD